MYQHLSGVRIVELSAFVAAPLAGMTLAQMGCDVIRVDPPSGGLDARRWPITRSGSSMFWRGLNKAKRSVAIDLRQPEGVELVAALITESGARGSGAGPGGPAGPGRIDGRLDGAGGGGVILTNLPQPPALRYEGLQAQRPDVISVEVQGYADGSPAVDYTVAARTGVPYLNGPFESSGPVNSVLPAWDVATGFNAALATVLALRQRELTGQGGQVQVALADVALSTLSSLGFIDEETEAVQPRSRDGNYLYGAFGRDFGLADGRRVMIVAITRKQWQTLVSVLGIAEDVADLERSSGLDLSQEGDRYAGREAIAAIIEPWCATRGLAEVAEIFDRHRIAWSQYQTATSFADACLAGPDRPDPPIAAELEDHSRGYRAVDTAIRFTGARRAALRRAPILGEHTEAVLADLLGLAGHQIAGLVDRGIVALEQVR